MSDPVTALSDTLLNLPLAGAVPGVSLGRVGSSAVESDEDLMAAAQRGDEDALSALITRYRKPLYGFLWRRVDGDVDDLFQETWLRVVRSRHRFSPQRRFSTWLFQIANNLCRDRARRRAAERRRREGFGQTAPTHTGPPSGARIDARRLLSQLSDAQREAVVSRYYEGHSEAETAALLGIPRGTVKSRLHAALARLRQELAAEPAAEDVP
jgi:RNA polymerase sigma-70 factor (ECF subfamily)